jgi:hypothetical protein
MCNRTGQYRRPTRSAVSLVALTTAGCSEYQARHRVAVAAQQQAIADADNAQRRLYRAPRL